MSNQSKKTIAKALFTQYSVAPNLLEGWWAQPDGDSICVHRKDGSTRHVSVGEELPIGIVSLDDGILKVGERAIPYFDTEEKGLVLQPGHARALEKRKNQPQAFMVETGNARGRIVEGEASKGTDIISVLDGGHIKAGKKIIPVARKEYELMLLVMNEPDKGGYKAYMNYKEPGSSRNMKDGIRGVYIKAKGNEPAKFCEIGPDGEMYPTAVFWSTFGRAATPRDVEQVAKEMESFGVSRDDALKDIQHAIDENGARKDGLIQNIEYCKKRHQKEISNNKSGLKPGYVRKAIQEGFVPYESAQTKYANGQCRPLDQAILERDLYREKQAIQEKGERIRQEIQDSGIDDMALEDHWDYDPQDNDRLSTIESELEKVQKQGWQSNLFTFLAGAHTMHRNKGQHRGRSHQQESKGP